MFSQTPDPNPNMTPQKKNPARARRCLVSLLALSVALPAFAQVANPPAANAPETKPDEKDVLTLSPFVVTTAKDTGYYAANTLAGSRMSTNLADIGASISVVTKQQLEDTASTDINDIFRYEVNTEGSSTYTQPTLSMRGDGVLDVNAGGQLGNSMTDYTNATANRVRGLGAPSSAINYYPAIGAVPFDAYNTQSVEISRGPNSMLFGLGSPAGIVNQSTAQAELNRRSASVSFRTDQYGSFRSSLSFNQGLIDDKLAIYGAALYDDRRFDRDPSYDKTERIYGAITFKPFKKTTLRVNAEKYENDNHRPNTLTPRDFVTQWNLAGQPYYDPVTRKITSLATGQQLSVLVNNASSPYANEVRSFIESRPGYDPTKWNAARTTYNGQNVFGDTILTNLGGFVAGGAASSNTLFVPGLTVVNQGRSIMQIADGQLVNWFQPTYQYKYLPGFGTPTNPAANPTTIPTDAAIYANSAWADVFTRSYTTSTGWTGNGNGIIGGNAGYKYPGVTDSSIYDWRNININSANFGSGENTNLNLEFEQELPGDLFFSAGWFRQDFNSRSNYTVAQLNVATLFVDTNKNLPDGTPNPYFGKPYLEDQDPDSYITEQEDDHYRAMLAWTPDFTRNEGWTRWLGRHQVLGLWSRDEYMTTNIRQRLHYIAAASDAGKFRYLRNPNPNADGTPTGWNRQTTSLRRTYYLASPGDPNGVVTQAAGYWDYLQYSGSIKAYDYGTSQFTNLGMMTEFIDFDANSGRNQRIVDSLSAGVTSNFWNDRLITTFGVRKDEYKARVTNTGLPAVLDSAGNVVTPAITNPQKWVDGVFQRDFLFNRWGPYSELSGTTRTLGGVLRPFQKWASIEHKAQGSLFWEFVRDFGISYNESGNFNPPTQALGDFYGNQLPKPTGEGKDYGFQFSLFDQKLFARVTWFEASNQNENISAPNVFNRLANNMDETLFRNWARTISLINMGKDPRAPGFGENLSQTEENAVQDAAEVIWQMPYDYYTSRPYARGATRNAQAEGIEAEINYNPTANWTLKFTFGKQDTKYDDVLKEYEPWYAERSAVWMSAKAIDYLLPEYQALVTQSGGRVAYTTSGGREVDLTNFWSSFGYRSELFPDTANGADNPEDYYNTNVLPFLLLDRDLQGQSVMGQRKYRWSFLTSYTFDEGRFKGFTVGGSERWEDKAVIGYYGKASGANGTLLDISDVNRPIYEPANYYTDLWVSYRRPILNNKVTMKLQLNVNNALESGELRAVGVNYDGSPYSFRIIDPRQFILTASFDF